MATARSEAMRSCEAGDDSKHSLGTRAKFRLSLLAIKKELLRYTVTLTLGHELGSAACFCGVNCGCGVQLAQDPSVEQRNPRVPEWQKLGCAACFCGVNRLFGVQLTQDPSVDQLNRLVPERQKNREASHASAV